MPSLHETLMQRCGAPVLTGALANGVAVYHAPGSEKQFPERESIIAPVEIALVPSEIGVEQRETRTVRVLRSLVDAAGIKGFQYGAAISVEGRRWLLDDQSTKWGETFVTFGLVGQPLVRKPELRRAAI